MPVGYVRPEVALQKPRWDIVRDALGGEEAVKARREKYLPKPNPKDKSPENVDRYNAYLRRAVFYGVTKRTLDGLVGQVFSRPPAVSLPDAMKVLEADVDGGGVSLVQQAQKALASTVGYGRCGLLTDYPPAALDEDGEPVAATAAEIAAGFMRPTITLYEPWEIINWRTVTVGARRIYSLVVIEEPFAAWDDGFEVRNEQQYRVLRLVPPPFNAEAGETPMWREARYVVQIWRVDNAASAGGRSDGFALVDAYEPRDSDGAQLREIPFTFIGALNNDASIDHAPLCDLASLNVAHYRNSADYEEVCYLLGQPQPWASGLDRKWVDEVINKNGKFMLGARAPLMLPAGGQFGLAQISPNTMLREAMDSKERQMVALGARIVEQRQVQRTATEAAGDDAVASSSLATIAGNVSSAYTAMLRKAAQFIGASFPANAAQAVVVDGAAPQPQEIALRLNTDFPAARMTPQERQQLVAEWQAGAISRTEMRTQFRRGGIATQSDEEAQEEIDSDPNRQPAVMLPIAGEGAGGEAGSGEGEAEGRVAA